LPQSCTVVAAVSDNHAQEALDCTA
jgi:hypothetical protein